MLDFLKKRKKDTLEDVPLPPPSMRKKDLSPPEPLKTKNLDLPPPPVVKQEAPIDIPKPSNVKVPSQKLSAQVELEEHSQPIPKNPLVDEDEMPSNQDDLQSEPNVDEIQESSDEQAEAPVAMTEETESSESKIEEEQPEDKIDDIQELKQKWAGEPSSMDPIRSAIEDSQEEPTQAMTADVAPEAPQTDVDIPFEPLPSEQETVVAEETPQSDVQPNVDQDFSLPDFDEIPEPEVAKRVAKANPINFAQDDGKSIYVRAYQYVLMMKAKDSITGIMTETFQACDDFVRINSDQDEIMSKWYVGLNQCQENLIKVDQKIFGGDA